MKNQRMVARYTTVFRLYELVHGLLVKPEQLPFLRGHIATEYATEQEAFDAIVNAGVYAEIVILPVVVRVEEWIDE